MAELAPAPFADLVTRLYREPKSQDAIFELPRCNWYLPRAGDPDLSVVFHGERAGNPVGPAAGPHTQMAQNLLLSYVAGGRIMELKTVQVKDRLDIPRPCIDMTNIGYNVEWSQELAIEDSLREYVAGAMLIQMFRRATELTAGNLDDAPGDWIFDLSVGYDLAGIQSEKVCRFLGGMRDATKLVDQLRGEIPKAFSAARDAEYLTHLSDSITLSTFHGCPADEIEAITEFLIGEKDFNVIVKMNPPTLGREKLEHLLHDVLGYRDLRVNPLAYASAVPFDESVAMCERLTSFAAKHNRRVGFKFSNTLEVENHRDFFTPDNTIMYLSGQPLHVITMALTAAFREAVGPDVPISFSAGIDRQNFTAVTACGIVPITISTDLLRPGGYGRLPKYLHTLADEMKACGADDVPALMRNYFGLADEAKHRASQDAECKTGDDPRIDAATRWAGLLNTKEAARLAAADPRYRADKNAKIPKRIDSHLAVFDCISCDKCLPVCPNAANFVYPTPLTQFEYRDLEVSGDAVKEVGDVRTFAIDRATQIACYADFCNECGNCDTFCPEYGGPYIQKPSFFGTRESWAHAVPRDGFFIECDDETQRILGRIKGNTFELSTADAGKAFRFRDEHGEIATVQIDDARTEVSVAVLSDHPRRIDMWVYHTLRHLLRGVTDPSRLNQVNAGFANLSA